MLAYLALEGPQHRQFLAELFFPESDDAADALSTTLRRLRGMGLPVNLRDKQVATSVACDVAVFLEHLRNGNLSEAVSIHGGVFASGLSIPVSAQLKEWILETREHLATEARRAHLRLAELALQTNDFGKARQPAETAHSLIGSTALEHDEAVHLSLLLERTRSPLASRLRNEVFEPDVALPHDTLPPPTNLPALLTSFIGRDTEKAQVWRVLSRPDGRLITIHGSGGVGKTRFALQLGQEVLARRVFPDRVYFVGLDRIEVAAQIASETAKALDVLLQSQDDLFLQLQRMIGNKRQLIILDNFEYVLNGASSLPSLLGACPNLTLMVTSRERLNLKAEWVLTLHGLSLPDQEMGLQEALEADALRLFSERAKQVKLDFELTERTLTDGLRVCGAVGQKFTVYRVGTETGPTRLVDTVP